MCIHANVHIHASVSQDSSIKKMVIHIRATSTKIDTHLILQRINVVMSSLDLWSAVDKDKAPDSSSDTYYPHSAGTLIIK